MQIPIGLTAINIATSLLVIRSKGVRFLPPVAQLSYDVTVRPSDRVIRFLRLKSGLIAVVDGDNCSKTHTLIQRKAKVWKRLRYRLHSQAVGSRAVLHPAPVGAAQRAVRAGEWSRLRAPSGPGFLQGAVPGGHDRMGRAAQATRPRLLLPPGAEERNAARVDRERRPAPVGPAVVPERVSEPEPQCAGGGLAGDAEEEGLGVYRRNR